MLFLHKRVGRIALTVFLLLATQLAFAGQVCRAVMSGGVADDCPTCIVADAGAVTVAAELQPPCCDNVVMATSTCLTALEGMTVVAIASGGVPLSDLPLPIQDHSITVATGANEVSVSQSTTSVGPLLPTYILFRRFLS